MYKLNNVVDEIENFTSQRDKDLLEFSLLKSVNAMMSCSKAELISVRKNGDIIAHMTFENSHCELKKGATHIDVRITGTFQKMNNSSIDEYNLTLDTNNLLILLLNHDRMGEQFLVIHLNDKIDKAQSHIFRVF